MLHKPPESSPWQCPTPRGEKAEAEGSTGIAGFLIISHEAMTGFCRLASRYLGNIREAAEAANVPEASQGKPNRSLRCCQGGVRAWLSFRMQGLRP